MKRAAATILLCGTMLVSGTARAQALSGNQVATAAVARACQGNAGQVLSRARLAEALVVEARVAPTLGEMAAIAAVIERTGSSDRVNRPYRNAVRLLQEGLARAGSAEAEAISVSPPAPPLPAGAPNWLFNPTDTHILTCAAARPDRAPRFEDLRPVAIRGSVDALDDLGEERETAAAAQVGWERTRTTNLDGETTRTETFTVDAAAGVAIGTVDRFILLYGDYSRNRTETRDNAGESSVDDVEALELGVLGTARLGPFRTTGRLGVTLDEITGARYVRGNLRLVPIVGARGNLRFCNLNSYRTIAPGIRARCSLAAEIELRDVLTRGTAQIGNTDILAAAGGTAGIEIGPGIGAKQGIVASARYTYLAVVSGPLPDIKRFEANLSYRWWLGDIGLDIGLTYVDGTERKSFADEHRLGFRIGLIY